MEVEDSSFVRLRGTFRVVYNVSQPKKDKIEIRNEEKMGVEELRVCVSLNIVQYRITLCVLPAKAGKCFERLQQAPTCVKNLAT